MSAALRLPMSLLVPLGFTMACAPEPAPTTPAEVAAPDTVPAPPAERPQPAAKNYSIDLLAKAADFQSNRPDATDGEFYVYRSDHATVHMHLIGVGQMCPLHIHRSTHEATIIVSGSPEVVHVHGEAGALTETTRRVPPGQLVYSPPLCGHQWTNVEPVPQANLVIASPKFDGNLYLHADDARMLPGPAPTLIDAGAALADVTASELRPTGLLDGQLSLALVRQPLKVHTDSTRDSVVYVAHGMGELGGLPLKPGVAAVLSGGEPVDLVSTSEGGLAVWIFTPPKS